MTAAESSRLPLGNLSDADKDALIARLWRDLQDARARSNELARRLARHDGAAPAIGTFREKLARTGNSQPQRQPSPALVVSGLFSCFGSRFGRGLVRGLVVVSALIAAAFMLDVAVSRYQQVRLDQKRLAELRLQHAAYEGMYVELVNVAYEPDEKSYRLTMKVTNAEPGHPLYVMQTPVRVFEQAGLAWREVPSKDPGGQAARVVRLANEQTFESIFEPNLAEWTELIPGYMHIRFEIDSLVSERSDPDDDIIDRTDRYYVYLKPHGADDNAIRRRLNTKGDPPVYMPMPPH
jgi:hypothetical protein